MSEWLTIGELARRGGVTTSALRFYERRGLLRATRTDTGHRRYPQAAERRLAFILIAQRVGLTLDDVAAELERLPPDGAPARREWTRLTRTWATCVERRIADLEQLRSGIADCIGCGCLSLDRCRFANPDDVHARQGPGPRRWLGDHPFSR